MAVDKDMVVTDEIVDELLEDWLERDGKAFTHIRKRGNLIGKVPWKREVPILPTIWNVLMKQN